mgnify:CR=1 FL=1
MTNTLKHLSLLTRMENSGLKPRLTGKFPEDVLDQTCERVETFQLQDRLRAGDGACPDAGICHALPGVVRPCGK